MENCKKVTLVISIFLITLLLYAINSQYSGTSNNKILQIPSIPQNITDGKIIKPTPKPVTQNAPNVTITAQQSDKSSTDNRHLIPPPQQDLVAEQYQRALEYLGYTYEPPNNWLGCKHPMQTYYFPKINKVFTGVPKAGCSNWIEALLRAEGALKKPLESTMVYKVHGGLSSPYRMVHQGHSPTLLQRQNMSDAFSFTVLRNPWTRLVSGYRDKLSDEVTQGKNKRRLGIEIVSKARSIPTSTVERLNLYPTFEEFLEFVVENNAGHNIHFLPQHHILCMPESKYNFIVPLEYAGILHDEIFEKYINTTVRLLGSYDKSSDPRQQTSAKRAKEWFANIKPDLIEKLYKYYKPDFMILNYSNFTDDNFPLPLHNITTYL